MLVIRLAGVLIAVGLAVCILLWLATGQRKWLKLAWQGFRAALFVVALILLLMFGERLLVV